VCIASRILDPLSQESAALEMELFESSFQPRLRVQVASRSRDKVRTRGGARDNIFLINARLHEEEEKMKRKKDEKGEKDEKVTRGHEWR